MRKEAGSQTQLQPPLLRGWGSPPGNQNSGPAAHSAPRPRKEVAQGSHAMLLYQGLPTLGIPKPPKPLIPGDNTCLSSDGVGGGGVSNLLPPTGPSQDMCWGAGRWEGRQCFSDPDAWLQAEGLPPAL